MSSEENYSTNSTDQEPPGDSTSIDDLLPTLHVAILYSDVKREYFATEQLYIAEKGADTYAQNIADVLVKMGVKVDLIPGNDRMPEMLQKMKCDMAFNFVDTVKGSDSMSATIPGVLELLDIPYTGSGMLGISLSTNKFLMDNLLDASGIPTARHHLFNSASDYIPTDLRYPLISKLNETHGSIEISELAISQNEQQLRERLRYLIMTYKEPVLVEEFIAGRELSALYFESKLRKVYVVEKVFTSENPNEIMSFDLKWVSEDETIYTHSKYNDDQLIELVKKAAQVAHISDYGRFDIRLDISGRYHFIDTNPNPFFNPLHEGSLMTSILDIHGISFEETLKRIIANTLL